ncbi:MAG: hypothetical protein AAF560_24720 [Acidobacteriota bacterium]
MRRLLQNPAAQGTILALLCVASYAPALTRYFVSEDFFILRRMASSSLWQMTLEHLTGPLLEISFVKFYRPVAGFLLHLESLLWGAAPTGYLVTHLLVHLLNVALVYHLARRWSAAGSVASDASVVSEHGSGHRTALGVCAVFALYPLHPNAVLFVASFATLYSALFLLAALVLYERFRTDGGMRRLAASVGCFVLALGSYEQTVILPGLLIVRELMAAWSGRALRPRELVRRLAPTAPFVVLLGLYFGVRQAALGQLVAGYDPFRERLLSEKLAELATSIANGAVRLIYPHYGYEVPELARWGMAFAIALGSAWAIWRAQGEAARGNAESKAKANVELWFWGLGWAWILASQAPFTFALVVPGNGRYWYLTSIGLGLVVVAVARWLGRWAAMRWRSRPGLAARLAASVVLALLLVYFVLLQAYIASYVEAGRATQAIQHRLSELSADQPVFVTGVPDFLRGPRKVPVAQVYSWGLSDALVSPFVERGPVVYPLPDADDSALLPILERADLGATWRWQPNTSRLEPVAIPDTPVVQRIALRLAEDGGLAFQPTDAGHRLILINRGSSSTYPIRDPAPSTDPAGSDGWVQAPLPTAVIDSMHHVYDGEIYAWIEARAAGRLTAISRLERLTPAD